MYVCMLEFKTPHRQRVFEHTYINTYIRTYIHTYSLFARRINIGSTPARHTVPEAQKIKFGPGSPECFKTLTPRRLNIRRYFVFVAENPNQGMSVWGFRYEVSRLS